MTFLLGRGLTRGNRATKDWREMFTSRSGGDGVLLARHRTIFLRAMLLARRFDLIYIQTGPDFGSFAKVVLFAMLALAHGRRTVVSLHEVTAYTGRSGPLNDRIRAWALRHVRSVVFESHALREFHRSNLPPGKDHPSLGVVYVRYADPRPDARIRPPRTQGAPESTLTVGLIGGVTHKRRDYPLLISALRLLTPEERTGLRIVALGNCRKQKCHDIMGSIAEFVEVDFREGHLSEQEFLDRGHDCDLLVAPLIASFAYGQRKGTGAFGDAIRLARPLLVPAGSDPLQEFASFAQEFVGAEGLATALRQALADPPVLPPAALRPFEAASVLQQLDRDLSLGL